MQNDTQIYVRRNIEKLQATFPVKLAKREDSFGGQIRSSKARPLQKLEQLFSFTTLIFKKVMPYTPCVSGCSSCCHYPVTLSELEIEFIARGLGITSPPAIFEERTIIAKDSHLGPCPFLEADTCSIYELRPFVCRRHVTMDKDNHWCHPAKSNEIELSLLRFSGIEDAYLYLLETTRQKVVDIRQAFPVGCKNA